MRKFIKSAGTWLIESAFGVLVLRILGHIFHIPFLLGEDAATTWINDKIAEHLHISSPTVGEVLTFLLQWFWPFIIAVIALSGWAHRFRLGWLAQRAEKPVIQHVPRASYEDVSPGSGPNDLVPDWTIHDLFYYLRPDIRPSGNTTIWDEVGSDVLDKLGTGRLTAWGRPIIRGATTEYGNLSSIDLEFWKYADFEPYVFLLDRDGLDRHARSPDSKQPDRADIRFNMAQALRIWPDDGFAARAAAIMAYSLHKDKAHGLAAKRFGESEEGIINFFIGGIKGAVPIYGRKPPATIMERVPPGQNPALIVGKDNNSLHYVHDKHPTFVDLRVKSGDLKNYLDYIELSDGRP